MEIKQSFWKNKKVFITGINGFKGSWLSLFLYYLGAKVSGISTNSERFKLLRIFRIYTKVKNYDCDINNIRKLEKKIIKFRPEIIYHLAAQPLVIDSYKDPYETFKTNAFGTLNILEIYRKYNFIKSLVVITTDKCYKNDKSKKIKFVESDELGGIDPYSASKVCAEFITNSYSNSFFTSKKIKNIATARAGNVIGGGDWSENRLIPDIVKSMINKSNLIIRNPSHVRPWQHVLEATYGYILLGQKMLKNKSISGAFNFGPKHNDHLNVLQIYNLTNKLINKKIKYKTSKKFKSNKIFKESSFLALNSAKSKKILNWKSKYNSYDTVDKTILWYKNYYNKENMYDFSIKQIKEYLGEK